MVDVLVDLNRFVQQSVRYDIRMEPGVFPPEETLERGHGSCRDFAWLLVQVAPAPGARGALRVRLLDPAARRREAAARSRRRRARFDRSPRLGRGLPDRRGLGRARRDERPVGGRGPHPARLHAGSGDGGGRHGELSWAKTKEDDKVAETFAVSMSVQRMHESPRVTAPYTEEAWSEILALGRAVDAALVAGDVRLTMGGEPTFIADADREAPEWSVDALGPDQAPLRDRPAPAPVRPLRAPRSAPRGPGQVVPGGAAAALGAVLLLPQGRPAHLAQRGSVREGGAGLRDRGRCRRVRGRPRPGARGRAEAGAARLRRRLALHVARAKAPGQRRSVRLQARRSGREGSPRACLRAGARERRRLRAAAATRARRRAAGLAERPLARAARPALPHARRLADGLSPARSTRCPGRSRGTRTSSTRRIRSRRATRSLRRGRRRGRACGRRRRVRRSTRSPPRRSPSSRPRESSGAPCAWSRARA